MRKALAHPTPSVAQPATGAVELRVVVEEDNVIGEVLGRLKGLGRSVLHLTKMEPTLETVFIHHVGRGLADEETEVRDS